MRKIKDEPRIKDERAAHSFPVWCQEETCWCGTPAAHKVEETSGPEGFHPHTAYLCCSCFRLIGNCGYYPYDVDA